jgi:hypothetical protein
VIELSESTDEEFEGEESSNEALQKGDHDAREEKPLMKEWPN